MTLTFTQENGLYVAEFEATAPFSIHLERPRGGFINMLQRSVDSGTFVAVKNFNPNYNATQVIDADCGQGAVYPKWIRLESAVEPSVAEVTFESESSGGGAGNESTIEYLDLREYREADYYIALSILADVVNAKDANGNTFCGINRDSIRSLFGVSNTTNVTYKAVGIDFSRKVKANFQGQIMDMNIIDLITMSGANKDDIDAIPRITKEQFYSLEA